MWRFRISFQADGTAHPILIGPDVYLAPGEPYIVVSETNRTWNRREQRLRVRYTARWVPPTTSIDVHHFSYILPQILRILGAEVQTPPWKMVVLFPAIGSTNQVQISVNPATGQRTIQGFRSVSMRNVYYQQPFSPHHIYIRDQFINILEDIEQHSDEWRYINPNTRRMATLRGTQPLLLFGDYFIVVTPVAPGAFAAVRQTLPPGVPMAPLIGRAKAPHGITRHFVFETIRAPGVQEVTPKKRKHAKEEKCIPRALRMLGEAAQARGDIVSHLICTNLVENFRTCEDIGALEEHLQIGNLPVIIVVNRPVLTAPSAEYPAQQVIVQGRRRTMVPVNHVTCPPVYYGESIRGWEGAPTLMHIIYDPSARHVEPATIPLAYKEGVFIGAPDEVYVQSTAETHRFHRVNDPRNPQRALALQVEKGKRMAGRQYDDTIFVVYDIESYVDREHESKQVPFKIGCYTMRWTDADIDLLEDSESGRLPVSQVLDKVNILTGYECAAEFINALLRLHLDNPESKIVVVGFNSSNFDNVLLASEMLRHEDASGMSLDGIELHGSHVGSLNFLQGAFSFFDVRRVLVGSLDSVCTAFGLTRLVKQTGAVDFETINEIFEKHGEMNFFEALQPIEPAIDEYLRYDCLSLAIVFVRLVKVWHGIPCVAKYSASLSDQVPEYDMSQIETEMGSEDTERLGKKMPPLWCFPSLPAAMYRLMQVSWQHQNDPTKFEMVSPSLPFRNLVMQHMVGGGCSIFDHNPQEVVHGPVMSLDVCSMYPFVMAMSSRSWFPCGSPEETMMSPAIRGQIENAAIARNKDPTAQPLFQGYFMVSFSQAALAHPIYPARHPSQKSLIEPCKKPDGCNDWSLLGDASEQEHVFMHFFRYCFLRKYGCNATIDENGPCIIFPRSVRGYDLFAPLLDFMDIKMKQDEYKETESPLYNPSLREMGKLGPNATYGKFLQKPSPPQLSKGTERELENLMRCSTKCVPDSVSVVWEGRPLESGERTFWYTWERVMAENNPNLKPLQIGDTILILARQLMYEMLIYPLGHGRCLYWDTDSVKFLESDYHAVSTAVQHDIQVWPEISARYPEYINHPIYCPAKKLFGGLEDELGKFFSKHKRVDAAFETYIIQPKIYGVFAIDKETRAVLGAIVRMKGIRKDSLYLNATQCHASLGDFCSEGEVLLDMANQQFVASFAEHYKDEALGHGKANWNQDPGMAYQVFQALSQGETCYFLQTEFKRVVRNHRAHVMAKDTDKHEENFGFVITRFILKRIKITSCLD
jgi:hypothetical protein